jgi:hypothetical protein
MSRRHHGRSRHGRPRADGARAATDTTASSRNPAPSDGASADQPPMEGAVTDRTMTANTQPGPTPPGRAVGAASPTSNGSSDARPAPAPTPGPPADGRRRAGVSEPGPADGRRLQNGSGPGPGCTAPQLRRFIKSRPYVPMHELRRRFGIYGDDDDVTRVRIDAASIFVGLPEREGSLLGELLRGGEIGYELSMDPRSPIVVGVYPMRPVPRG